MYLYYVAIGTVRKRERRKRSDKVLVKLCSHWHCKERKKSEKSDWYSSYYDPVSRGVRSSGCGDCVLF